MMAELAEDASHIRLGEEEGRQKHDSTSVWNKSKWSWCSSQ